jgi:acetyl esterase
VFDTRGKVYSICMSLDPQCQAFLDQMAAQPGKPFEEMNLEEIQAFREAMPEGFGMAGPLESVARVEDRAIPTPGGLVPVRIYWPRVDVHLPVLLYFHGGGWVFGNLSWVDAPCRALANASGAIIVSVDYRLAPEHRYPTAAEDCYSVTKHIADHPEDFAADPARIAVSGDSAGGNLAAVVCQMARDRGGPHISYQLLIYPCVDYLDESPSMKENGEGYFLTVSGMKWFWEQYASVDHVREPYLSPLQAKTFADLPPALIISAEYDPLRDQGELYAKRLNEAGVPATVKRFDGMIHGFFHMSGFIEAGREAIDLSADVIAQALFPVAAK